MFVRILLTFVSAGFFALCFPDGPLPLIAFVCLVPFAVALNGVAARTGMLLGLLCGFCFWMIAAWWLVNGFYFYVTLSRPAAWFWTVAGCVVAALPYAFFGLLCGFFGWMKTLSGRLTAAAALTVLLAWYPFLFPGNHVHSLYAVPLVIQVLDLGGVPLLLFLVNLVNFLVAGAVLDLTGHRRPVKGVLAALGIIIFMSAYGAYRLDELHGKISAAGRDRFVQVVAVQPDLPLYRAGRPVIFGSPEEIRDVDSALALSAQAITRFADAQAIVWPELPGGISCDAEGETWKKVRALAGESGIPFIVNCYEYDPAAGGDYNNARLIDGTGEFRSRYRKRILLPFGEYLPGEKRLPWMRRFFPHALHYIPGADTTLLPIGGQWQAIPTLCYEVLFSGLVRDFVRQGGDVIINLVDDVWFGESDASAVHMALAVYRAAEFRIPLVRVTNSGNGVFVQPTGEIVKGSRTPQFEPRVTSFPLFVPLKRTFYTTFGDAFLIFLTVVWCGEVVVRICLCKFYGLYKCHV